MAIEIASLSKTFQNYLDLAKQEALKSTSNYRHGAVIIKNGSVIVRGHNSEFSKRIKILGNDMCSCHAEMDCLSKNINVDNGVMIIVRVLRNGEFANSKPCFQCCHLISCFHLKNIYYTIDNTFIGYRKPNQLSSSYICASIRQKPLSTIVLPESKHGYG